MFFKGKKGIPRNSTFRLTQVGTDKLQEFNGDPSSQVLSALDSRGTSTVAEIAQTTGLKRGKVERLIPGLINGQYVQYVNSSSVLDEEL